MSTRCPEPQLPLPELQPADVLLWDEPVVRIYSSGGDHPSSWSDFRSYGPVGLMRFDHHTGTPKNHPSRAISYAAIPWTPASGDAVDSLDVAVLECFTKGVLDRATGGPRLSVWKPTRPLRLLKLSDGTWLAHAKGNAALTSGARGTSRLWSRAIYDAYPDIDGLVWSSSVLPGGRSVALYERAKSALPSAPLSDSLLAEPALQPPLARIAIDYDLILV